MPRLATTRRETGKGSLAVRFILTSAMLYALAGGVAWLLVRFLPAPRPTTEATLPRVFWITTGLLIAGSGALHRAVHFVRREKQLPFRRSLVAALLCGTLFCGIQTYGLRCLARHQNPAEVETGANAFLTAISALHGMHFTLALLFLTWVTLNALIDRYDHEYFWGVSLCAWFWHALGAVWGLILIVFLIATHGGGA